MTNPDEELKLEMVEKEETKEKVSDLVLQLESDDLVELSESSDKEKELHIEEPLAADQAVEEISLDLSEADILESLSLDIGADEIAELPKSEEPSSPPPPPPPPIDQDLDAAPTLAENPVVEEIPAVEPVVEEISLDLSEDDIQESLSLEIGEDEIAELPTSEEPFAPPAPSPPKMEEQADVAPEPAKTPAGEGPPATTQEEAGEAKGFMEPVIPADPGQDENNIALAAKYEAEVKKKKKQMIIGAAALLGCLLIGGAGYFLYLDIANYNKAVALWGEANSLQAAKNYRSSQRKASQVLETLASLKLLKKGDADKLTAQVNALLSSEDFKNKVAGKVVYDGKLVKKEAVDKLENVKTTVAQAATAVEEANWQAALDLYGKAKDELKASGADTPEIAAEIDLAEAAAIINLKLIDGRNYLAAGDYENGLAILQKAFEVISENPTAAVDKHEEVKLLVERAKIGKLIGAAEAARRDGELDKALDSFNQALILAENNQKVSAEDLAEIRKSVREIKLIQMLTKGKSQFEAGTLEEALKSFDAALNFVLANPGDEGLAKNEAAIRKKRIELAAAISSNEAQLSKHSGNLPDAVRHQQNIIAMIEASPFADDAKLLTLKDAAAKEIVAMNNQIDIDQRLDYLTQNYKSIFQANHPLAKSASLSNPRIVFVEQEGQKQTFNLKCTGYTSTGRLAFDLNYQYDTVKKDWSVVGRRRAR